MSFIGNPGSEGLIGMNRFMGDKAVSSLEQSAADQNRRELAQKQLEAQRKSNQMAMTGSGMMGGAMLGAMAGSAVPVIGNVLGAIIGGIVGGSAGYFGGGA